MKNHLPYNILLAATVIAVGLMAIFNLALRQSGFAVTVGYSIPPPPVSSQSETPSAAPARPSPSSSLPSSQSRQDGALYQEQESAVVSVQFPLELNAATYEQLMFIPKVGNVTAQRIVQYREHLGGYTSMAQLMEIKGIAGATYQHITAYLYLEEPPQDEEEGGDEEQYPYGED